VAERVHRDRFVVVDGVRTHYLEAGEGPPVVLLHSGEFGGCAEFSWEYLLPVLATRHRVIAPDWLGFGETDKLHDFIDKRERMLAHLVRFLEVMAIDSADFVGNSMGATYLIRAAAETPGRLPLARMVVISGGGHVPDNEHRRVMLDYDCTREAMVALLQAMFVDPVWWSDPDYVARRHAATLAPGAWEAVAATRLRPPTAQVRSEFGQPDATPYERIEVETLLVAGAQDKLRLPGYAQELAGRIPRSQLAIVSDAGHCPNIETAAEVAPLLSDFLCR
jgi:pimeloyl-ACP methyl ester carboxylesterase